MSDRPRPYGPYVLLKPLATGGRGDVHLARPANPEPRGSGPVVIKRLHLGDDIDEEFKKRFKHEAQLAVVIDSPHVAKVYDAGRVGQSFYIAFEYIQGWALSRVIEDVSAAGHRPTLRSIVEIASGALQGLAALHDAQHPKTGEVLGIVHRDIAPKNIMVGEDGRTRLIDLGLGKSNVQDWKTGTGVVMGSPGYMAPEQVRGDDVDARTDTYAMGIVVWELLTLSRFIKRGPVPLMLRAQLEPERRAPSSLRPDIPAALDAVVLRALEPDPARRYARAEDFRAALLDAIELDDGPPAVNTLVGDMLWGELTRSKTEVTALLAAPTPSASSLVPETAEILAAREVTTPPLGPPAVDYGMPAASAGTPTPMPYAVPLGSGPLPAPSRGVPVRLVLGLMLMTLALGIGVGALLLRERGAPVVLTPAAAPPPPSPAAAAQPSAAPSAAPQVAPTEVAAEPEAAAPSAPKRTTRAKPTRSRAAAPSKPAKSSDPMALLQRVLDAKKRLERGSRAEAEAAKLVSALQAELAQPDPTRLRALARRVRALEANAPR